MIGDSMSILHIVAHGNVKRKQIQVIFNVV